MAKENQEMLKRLEKVEPMYKVSDWIEDWRKKEEITGMITAYPDDFQAIVSTISLIYSNFLLYSEENLCKVAQVLDNILQSQIETNFVC